MGRWPCTAGPVRGLPWAFPGLSCGWLVAGWLLRRRLAWRWVSGGLWWPPLAFPLGFVVSGWSGPSGPLRAFLRPFPGLSCVFFGAGCWCPCGESYLGPPWVPVGVLSEVLGWSCWDPGRKWSKKPKTTLSSCRWYGLCRGGARRVEDGLGKGSILSTHILPLHQSR